MEVLLFALSSREVVTFYWDDNFSWAPAALPKYELSSRPERSAVERPAVLSTSNES